MGINGLDINEEQFIKMNSQERDLIMFRNVTHIRKKFSDYKFHRRFQYIWLFILTIFVGLKKYLPV